MEIDDDYRENDNDLMLFIEKTKQRLAQYKLEKFPDLADGLWKKNKQPYTHILPEDNKFLNLLSHYRDELEEYLYEEGVKLHSDFHHLNSSQAMCMNFFYPLICEKKLEWIINFLGIQNEVVKYSSVAFEKDGLEASYGHKATSFDFYFETNSCKKFHFEIKYTESEFGKAKVNLNKFEKVYSNHLYAINPLYQDIERFYSNYQILRNIIHISDLDSYVIFIYPDLNLNIKNAAEQVPLNILSDGAQNNYLHFTWESILNKIQHHFEDGMMYKHYHEFQEKYF